MKWILGCLLPYALLTPAPSYSQPKHPLPHPLQLTGLALKISLLSGFLCVFSAFEIDVHIRQALGKSLSLHIPPTLSLIQAAFKFLLF